MYGLLFEGSSYLIDGFITIVLWTAAEEKRSEVLRSVGKFQEHSQIFGLLVSKTIIKSGHSLAFI